MTDTTTTPAIVNDYLAMWLEPDETVRRAQIDGCSPRTVAMSTRTPTLGATTAWPR